MSKQELLPNTNNIDYMDSYINAILKRDMYDTEKTYYEAFQEKMKQVSFYLRLPQRQSMDNKGIYHFDYTQLSNFIDVELSYVTTLLDNADRSMLYDIAILRGYQDCLKWMLGIDIGWSEGMPV